MFSNRLTSLVLGVFISSLAAGCFSIPGKVGYAGPAPRPPELEEYYSNTAQLLSYSEEHIHTTSEFEVLRIRLNTSAGTTVIDYFKRFKPSKELIFVFPVLGGQNIFENHFAAYFAHYGYDAAIVHRDADFKKPEMFSKIEEILRKSLQRDRLAMDFFESHYGKSEFGSLGISRGAINAAMTAGVDHRLKYNVLMLGASNIVRVVRTSDEKGLKKYRNLVMDTEGISEDQFYSALERTLKTDPKRVARYIDGRNTLLVFALFDNTVPLRYGLQLRRLLGRPKTIFLPTGHFTSMLYTQFARLLLPAPSELTFFPPDFIEGEALTFFDEKFRHPHLRLRTIPWKLLRLPTDILITTFDAFLKNGNPQREPYPSSGNQSPTSNSASAGSPDA